MVEVLHVTRWCFYCDEQFDGDSQFATDLLAFDHLLICPGNPNSSEYDPSWCKNCGGPCRDES